jgi:hypothetical protein
MHTNKNKYFFKMKFFYENLFYQFCTTDRLSKFIAQLKVFEETKDIFGDIAEFGVFKGNSLTRLIIFREIFARKKYVYAFDQFAEFKVPKLILGKDKKKLKIFLKEAGKKSVTLSYLKKNLVKRKLNRKVELIKGDIFITLDKFLKKNPNKKFSFINLDVDLYHITYFILQKVWSRLIKGGIILFDDYKSFPGATKAINIFLKENKNVKFVNLKYSRNFYYCKKV